MRARSRLTALIGLSVGVSLTLALAPSAAVADPALADPAPVESWAPELGTAEAAGVAVTDGTARLASSVGAPDRIGFLTFAPKRLPAPTDRITATLDAQTAPGTAAVIEARERRVNHSWTEWHPLRTGHPTPPIEPSREIQVRLVLTGPAGTAPTARGISIAARTTEGLRTAGGTGPALRYRIFATREGLVGGTTANGHTVAKNDHFVALPSRRALAQRGKDDYSVKVCALNGRCAWAPVWDVGPWNTHDDYWNPAGERENWAELTQGVPQAQAAFADGFNGGLDGLGRKVKNPAGIDLADGLFWGALGLTDNSWVQVTLLWTGSDRLLPVRADDGPVEVLSAPRSDAPKVGLAAGNAAVPVQCVVPAPPAEGGGAAGGWLRIGLDEFIRAEFVPVPADVGQCGAGA